MSAATNGPALHLTLPMPPSANHSHHNVTMNGRLLRVPSKQSKAWRQETIVICTDAMTRAGWTKPRQTKCVMELTIWWRDRRRRDADNLIKGIQDAIQAAGVIDDDRWLLPRVVDFSYDKEKPRVEVVVRRA